MLASNIATLELSSAFTIGHQLSCGLARVSDENAICNDSVLHIKCRLL